jgi:hypothetical protein
MRRKDVTTELMDIADSLCVKSAFNAAMLTGSGANKGAAGKKYDQKLALARALDPPWPQA